MAQSASGPGTRAVDLAAGWNLVGWTAAATPAAAVAGSLTGVLESLHTFDAEAQSFETLNASRPSFLNSLTEVGAGDGLWIFAEGAVRWQQAVLVEERTVALSAGFNLVTWTGPSNTPIDAPLEGLGAALEIAFTYEALEAVFASFGPGLPAFLNTAGPLDYGDGLWVKVTEAVRWSQPAPAPGGVFASADGVAAVTVPVGVNATVSVEAVSADALPPTVGGGATLSGYRVVLTPESGGIGVGGLRSAQFPGVPPDGVTYDR